MAQSANQTPARKTNPVGAYGIYDLVDKLLADTQAPSSVAELTNLLPGTGYPETPIPSSLMETPVGNSLFWDTPVKDSLGNMLSSGAQALGVGPETAGSIGSVGGYAIPGITAGVSGYNLAKNLMDNQKDAKGGAMSGAGLGAGAAALLGLGPLGVGLSLLGGGLGGGLLGGVIGGNKDKDQLTRDATRKKLKGNLINDNYQVGLADGSMFDIGKDGDAMLKNSGINIDGKNQRRYFDADFSRADTGDVVGMLNPLGSIIAGGSGKIGSDFTGYLTNAAQSSGDTRSNARAFYDKMGITKEIAQQILNEMVGANKLSAADRQAYEGGLNTVFGAAPLAKPQVKPTPLSIPKKQDQPVLNRTTAVNDRVGQTGMTGAFKQPTLQNKAVTNLTIPKKNRTGKITSVF